MATIALSVSVQEDQSEYIIRSIYFGEGSYSIDSVFVQMGFSLRAQSDSIEFYFPIASIDRTSYENVTGRSISAPMWSLMKSGKQVSGVNTIQIIQSIVKKS